MLKFMILCFIGIVESAGQTNSYPSYQQGYAYRREQAELSYKPAPLPQLHTEYFVFSAPADYNKDNKEVQRLSSILRPQRVVFIRSPEKNIFSITAEQLAKKDSLNIYLLRRDTNTQGLLSQLDEIRQRVAQKPNVHFIKYKTPEDLNRAKQAVFNDFESIPGASHYHEDIETPVYDFDSKSRQLYQKSVDSSAESSPVIFEIIKRNKEPARVVKEAEDKEELRNQQYLSPPRLQ